MLKKVLFMSLFGLILSGCQTASNISTNGDHVQVGHTTWDKSGNVGFSDTSIPTNQSRVVFIRPATNYNDQSSANIALDDRYLVSLQANHYTESLICSGNALISVLPTGVKSNNLQALPLRTTLKPQNTYFYVVDVDKTTNQPSLTAVDAQQAQQLLKNKALQTHQISRVVNNCTTPVAVAPVVVQPIASQTIPTLRLNILFDYDKSDIKPQYQSEIAKAAQFLANYPNMQTVIEGHTDSRGSDSYNQRLSQRRADSVRSALISQYGIDANRISAIGYGESRPVATNDTDAGRQENRRVMVVIPNPSN